MVTFLEYLELPSFLYGHLPKNYPKYRWGGRKAELIILQYLKFLNFRYQKQYDQFFFIILI